MSKNKYAIHVTLRSRDRDGYDNPNTSPLLIDVSLFEDTEQIHIFGYSRVRIDDSSASSTSPFNKIIDKNYLILNETLILFNDSLVEFFLSEKESFLKLAVELLLKQIIDKHEH